MSQDLCTVGVGLGSAAEAISEVPGKISQTIGGTANAIRNNIRSKTDKIFGKRVDKDVDAEAKAEIASLRKEYDALFSKRIDLRMPYETQFDTHQEFVAARNQYNQDVDSLSDQLSKVGDEIRFKKNQLTLAKERRKLTSKCSCTHPCHLSDSMAYDAKFLKEYFKN